MIKTLGPLDQLDLEKLHIIIFTPFFLKEGLEGGGKLLLVSESGNEGWFLPSTKAKIRNRESLSLQDFHQDFLGLIIKEAMPTIESQYGVDLCFPIEVTTLALRVPDGDLVVVGIYGDAERSKNNIHVPTKWVSPDDLKELAWDNLVGKWGEALHRISLSVFPAGPSSLFREQAAEMLSELPNVFALPLSLEA